MRIRKIGQKDKGYNYLLKSIEPIDKRFKISSVIYRWQEKKKPSTKLKKYKKSHRFYSYLFEVMKPYDSTYPKEKKQKSPDK